MATGSSGGGGSGSSSSNSLLELFLPMCFFLVQNQAEAYWQLQYSQELRRFRGDDVVDDEDVDVDDEDGSGAAAAAQGDTGGAAAGAAGEETGRGVFVGRGDPNELTIWYKEVLALLPVLLSLPAVAQCDRHAGGAEGAEGAEEDEGGEKDERGGDEDACSHCLHPSRSRVLDVGCGNGHLAALLASRGWQRVTGTDLCGTAIELARLVAQTLTPDAAGAVTFLEDDARASALASGSMDVIIDKGLLDTLALEANPQADLEAIERQQKVGGPSADLRKCAADLSRVLAPGGVLVIVAVALSLEDLTDALFPAFTVATNESALFGDRMRLVALRKPRS